MLGPKRFITKMIIVHTIIVQHVETYKIMALDNDLIVIVMFHTATGATRCINKCSSIDIEIARFIKH